MLDVTQDTREKEAPLVFSRLRSMDHEQVVYFHDSALGLRAIVGIHNTVLGPAMGGVRMWHYGSEAEALQDALRLSRGMTYKSALAGLNIGGGKAVIIGDANKDKNEAFMRRFGQFVHSLGGRYWTAADVNMNISDMEYIRAETPHVLGLPAEGGGSGDPSPVTAYGIYIAMKAACKVRFGRDSLSGKKVAVQGAGKVGQELIALLSKANVSLWVSDVNESHLSTLSKQYRFEVVRTEDIYDLDVDIYAPCALGATLNADTIPRLRCSIIAGAANNQLADEDKDMLRIQDRDLLYAPDFLINSGGIINVYSEYQGHYRRELALRQVDKIYPTLLDVFSISDSSRIGTYPAALQLAQSRIDQVKSIAHGRQQGT